MTDTPLLAEAGTGGVRRSGGFIDDDWNPKLAGRRANLVYREMHDNSGLLGGSMRAIQFLIQQAPWMVESRNGGNSPLHMFWRDRIRDALFNDLESTWEEVIMTCTSVIPFGWVTPWQSWKICRGDNPSRMFSSQFDDGLWMPRDLEPRSQETLWEWIYDEDDRYFTGWRQMAPPQYSIAELDASRYMHIRLDPDRGNPQGRSMYRNATRDYYFIKRLEDVRGVGEERNLAGIPVIRVPTKVMAPNADPQYAAIRSQMETKVQQIRTDQLQGIVFPCAEEGGNKTGYDISLMSAGGRDRGSVNEAISDHKWGMMVSVLSQFLLLGSKEAGSFALSSSQTDLFATGIGAVMNAITSAFNRQLIPRIMILNEVPREYWPELQHGDIESEDATKIVTSFTQAVQAQWVKPTYDDEVHARKILSWPQRKGDESQETLALDQATEAAKAQAPVEGELPPTVEPEQPQETAIAMTPDEVAQQLNMTPLQVMAAIRGGKLVGRRVGRTYRVMPDQLEEFMRNE